MCNRNLNILNIALYFLLSVQALCTHGVLNYNTVLHHYYETLGRESELFRRAYIKIVASRINSLPLRFIRNGAFSRPGKRHLFADPSKTLEKGYDRVLKSCRRYKEKAASAFFPVCGPISHVATTTTMVVVNLLVVMDELFRIFLHTHTHADANMNAHPCAHEHHHCDGIWRALVRSTNVYYIRVEMPSNCERLLFAPTDVRCINSGIFALASRRLICVNVNFSLLPYRCKMDNANRTMQNIIVR